MAEFMCKLYHLLGITILSLTTYHPQSDGQTEHVNQELEQYIQVFINRRQNDWDTLLPLGESVYNNHIHTSTQHSPSSLIQAEILVWVLNPTNDL